MKTLESISREAGHFDESFNLVDKLIQEYGEERIATHLYAEIDESVDWAIIADLFGILVWSTSDNGRGLSQETEQWLVQADDPRKIKIALNLDVCPFLERKKMESVLNRVANKYPQLANECRHLIVSRRQIEA